MANEQNTPVIDALQILARVPEERKECVEALNHRLGLLE